MIAAIERLCLKGRDARYELIKNRFWAGTNTRPSETVVRKNSHSGYIPERGRERKHKDGRVSGDAGIR